MAEADFEIDFYGDAANDRQRQQDNHYDDHHPEGGSRYRDESHGHEAERVDDFHQAGGRHGSDGEGQPPHQGVKRKSEELNDRPIDNGATSAIMISELSWWTTDDDIRGWLRKAESEDEVKEVTFSEHKVNGKSKGQAYIEFESRQAATAAKRYIDQVSAESNQPGQKKATTSYWNPGLNPFRTLPKDAPMRAKEQPRTTPSGSFPDRGGYGGPFRGGRGGMNGGRGGMGGGMNQNFNRNFGGNMGFNNMGGGFNNPMGGGGPNFGFQNRGGGMMGAGMGGGMRGGPGAMRGRGGNVMGMNPMGGMNMGMPGNMGMGMMGGGMPGFQGMIPNFGGNFGFGPNQGGGGGGGDWGNPHGAKRPRPE